MKNLKKKISGVIITGAVAALSVSSAFAGTTNIASYNSVNVDKGSYVDTFVSQNDSKIKAKGGDITITSLTEKKIDRGSIVETGIFEDNTEIDATGKNIDIVSGNTLTVDRGSVAETLINDVKSKIRTRTR